MDIAIDFDGTCVTHDYPKTGNDIGAQKVLKKLLESGHNLILYTMRSGAGLENALQWFIENEIHLYGIQYNPEQARWTSSNKCYAQLYIDDAALGIPLVTPRQERPYVDWEQTEVLLVERGLIGVQEG